jgi:N-acetylneuraminic acid mutarotase
MPEPRYDVTACVVGSDIYVFGGFRREHSGCGNESVFKYNTQIDEWSKLAPMPAGDHGVSAIELGGVIHIVGVGDTSCGLMRYDPVLGV